MSTAFTPVLDDDGKPKPETITPEAQQREAGLELRGILNKILFESLDLQMKEAIAEAAADPTAMQRYKVLFERRKQLGLIPQKLVESQD
jgi:hypothetical protein